MTTFHAAAMPYYRLAQALPLIQVTWPEVDLEAWRSFALAATADGGGVLALSEDEDYICGLLAYRRQATLGGPVMQVHLFTVADIVNRQDGARLLLDAAENLARRQGCGSVRLELSGRQAQLGERLRRLGAEKDDAFLLARRCD